MKQRLRSNLKMSKNAGSGPRRHFNSFAGGEPVIGGKRSTNGALALDKAVRELYYETMAPQKTKADKLAGVLDELTVATLDEKLTRLGREWTRHYKVRQMLAEEEGDTTPPPAPPRIDSDATEAAVLSKAANQKQTAGGTVGSLIQNYRDDKRSPYHSLRHKTRAQYDGLIRRIGVQCGDIKLNDLTADSIWGWYELWSENGAKAAMGHSLVTMLRGLLSFGSTVLEDAECERLFGAMRRLKFEYSAPRTKQITAEQAAAIRAKAHEMGLESIALAQAFQYDCKFSQKDCIGEWVPINEPVSSEVIFDDMKWVRGLRWNEIDEENVLRHVTSRSQEEVVFDLNTAPMVLEELSKGWLSTSGPMIVCETTHRPWTDVNFRRRWRDVARAAGVPDDVLNADSGTTTISAADERIRRVHRRVDDAMKRIAET